MDKSVAVLIPCYNEGLSVADVVADFRRVLPDASIYVYDNNSTDDTVQKARDAGAVVCHEYRRGKGNVIRTMFHEIEAECYIMVDGDDTYCADKAAEMAELVFSGRADMVIGDRLSGAYFKENKRRFHNFGNVLVRWLINRLFNTKINDIMTGLRALSRDFVKSFPVLSQGFEIETEMTVFALYHNFKIMEVPIEYKDRAEGSQSKLSTYRDGAKVLKTIFSLFRDYKPLRFFSAVAVILLLVAVIFFVPVLIEYFKTGLVPRFPTLIISGFLTISALLSWFCGLILDVNARRMRQMFEILRNK